MLDHLCENQAICSQNLSLQCNKISQVLVEYMWIVVSIFVQFSDYQDKILKLYSFIGLCLNNIFMKPRVRNGWFGASGSSPLALNFMYPYLTKA